MKKEILIGFIVALIATVFGYYLYVVFLSPYEFDETIKVIREGELWGKVLGLAAIPNLFVFFIYLKKKQDYRARGVLLASFMIAFIILLLQFL
ncbi:MAG: hypothetical protein ABFR32_05690 [Bacteroidota bacterium]